MITHSAVNVALDVILPENLPQLHSWRNNGNIYNWCRQRDLIDIQDHEEWFLSLKNNKSIKMYLIKETNHSIPVGVCGLTSIDLYNQHAEFSLYIAPDSHGFGLGQQALKLLLHHGFNTYPLNIIYGETFETNKAFKLFMEMGFRHEGTRRDFYYKNGRYLGAHLVSIRRDEFDINKSKLLKAV